MTEIDFSKKLLVLAPLAGYTDLPFRSLAKEFGADITVSEMVSSNALVYNNVKTLKMVEKSANESPYFVQIAGNNKTVIKKAVEILNDIPWIDGIDLNCGCPAPKVFNHGSGSSLLGDLCKLQEILETVKETNTKKYTSAKIRIGVNEKIPVEIAKVVEKCGVDFVSVHGRTRKGAYKEAVDYDAIREIKENISIPVIANGDIVDFDKYNKVMEFTKCDGAMIGRGAIGKPWIFYQIKQNAQKVSNQIICDVVTKHFENMVEFYGEFGVPMFRKHLHVYSKGFKGASEFREKMNTIKDVEVARSEISNFFKGQI